MKAESNTATTESGTPVMDHPYRSPGTMLRQAREEAGLALEDVVAHTRMTLHNVRALENDDFVRLQSDTFTRGYLRMYAKLLQLDVDPLLAAYAQARCDAGLKGTDDNPLQCVLPTNASRPLWHFAVSILALLVGLWMLSVWFLGNERETETVSTNSVVENRTVEAPVDVELITSAAAAEPVEPSGEIARTDPAEALTSASNDQQPVSLGDVAETQVLTPEPLDRLHLAFTDECWLEVTDAQGDVLVTDLVQPGQELHLQGQAPFDVKMGNAHVVQLSLNGAAFDLDVPVDARLMTVSVGQ